MTPAQQEFLDDLQKLVEAATKMREAVERVFVLPKDQVQQDQKCPKCGITLSPVMGYSCAQALCPTGLGSTYTI